MSNGKEQEKRRTPPDFAGFGDVVTGTRFRKLEAENQSLRQELTEAKAYQKELESLVANDEGLRQAEKAEQHLEQARERGNRLAVVAQECHDKLLEATGSADGWKVIEDWWAGLAELEKA